MSFTHLLFQFGPDLASLLFLNTALKWTVLPSNASKGSLKLKEADEPKASKFMGHSKINFEVILPWKGNLQFLFIGLRSLFPIFLVFSFKLTSY